MLNLRVSQILVPWGLKAHPAYRAPRVFKAFRVLKAFKAYKGLLESRHRAICFICLLEFLYYHSY